jgi:hypothetical protein
MPTYIALCKTITRTTTKAAAAILLISTLVLHACGDNNNPVNGNNTTHSDDAVGLVVRDSGTEIVRSQNGQTNGAITIGLAKQSALLALRFIAEDGDLFVPEDEAFSLDWEIADPDVAVMVRHEEDGRWAFHIIGLAVGETTIRLKINHFDHADFVSAPIQIHVTPDGPGTDTPDHDHDSTSPNNTDPNSTGQDSA